MSTQELNDNLIFLAALQMLGRLLGKGLLTEAEAKTAENHLRRSSIQPSENRRFLSHL